MFNRDPFASFPGCRLWNSAWILPAQFPSERALKNHKIPRSPAEPLGGGNFQEEAGELWACQRLHFAFGMLFPAPRKGGTGEVPPLILFSDQFTPFPAPLPVLRAGA